MTRGDTMRNRYCLLLKISCATLICLSMSDARGRALEIRGIALTVANLDRAVAFYETALSFKKLSERVIADPNQDVLSGVFGTRVRIAELKLGTETIELQQYLSPMGLPVLDDSRANDLWFQHFAVVVSDMDKAYAQVARASVRTISTAPQTLPASNTAAAGIRAFKFKDPDGHPLELLYFPPDKGNPKWHRARTAVFLGIDHTAITISATDRSLDFYQNLLGLHVVGNSLNSGPTQADLDGTPGAVVRITGLRADRTAGIGLEFLEYQAPTDGRPTPILLHANDMLHMHIILEVDNLDHLTNLLTSRGQHFVSPRAIHVAGLPYAKVLMVLDPDGHVVLLVQLH